MSPSKAYRYRAGGVLAAGLAVQRSVCASPASPILGRIPRLGRVQRFKISPHVSEAADGSGTPAAQIDAYQLTEMPWLELMQIKHFRCFFYPQRNVGYFFWNVFAKQE